MFALFSLLFKQTDVLLELLHNRIVVYILLFFFKKNLSNFLISHLSNFVLRMLHILSMWFSSLFNFAVDWEIHFKIREPWSCGDLLHILLRWNVSWKAQRSYFKCFHFRMFGWLGYYLFGRFKDLSHASLLWRLDRHEFLKFASLLTGKA